MATLFERLNDPVLVYKFQRYFGVKPATDSESTEKHELPALDEDSDEDNYMYNRYTEPVTGINRELLEDYDSNGYGSIGHHYNLRSRKTHPRSPSEWSIDSSRQEKRSSDSSKNYTVESKFFYWLFVIGASLGNEMFYCLFFPYWFWNVDGYVCRRLVLTWCMIMYLGQALKDIVRLPRPGPPVIRMEKRYELEYGMPSTHAMIGLAFPMAFLYFTINRYEYNTNVGITLGVCWCLCVCLSRLYLGMHSVADVLAGLALSFCLMLGIIPALEYIDEFQLKSPYAPVVMIAVTLLAALAYPSLDEWSTCRGDTMLILGLPSWSTCRGDTTATLGVTCGVAIASWLNYQFNFIPHDAQDLVGPPPYHIKTPDLEWVGLALLRMLIGCSLLFLTRAIMKQWSYKMSCWIFKLNPEDFEQNKKYIVVELPYKYLTYAAISLNVVYLSPVVFRYLNIERPTAWTEL